MTDASRDAAEFDLIERIRARALHRDDVVLGIGDDAAIVQVPVGKHLVVATDTLNAGVHFPLDTAPADIGWKALAVNLSDLAAMAAEPAWCTLSLSLPRADTAWLDAFLDGFLDLASRHGVALVGGDTTRGPLSIGVTVHGFVAPGGALRRDGARAGDEVWVSGTLGDAAGALRLLSEGLGEGPEQRGGRTTTLPAFAPVAASHAPAAQSDRTRALRPRLDRPEPRVATGRALAGVAHACIDLSDGLLADLAHVCHASGVAAEVDLSRLPASPALAASFDEDRRHALQATGGDDYELCFTAPPDAREAIESIARQTGTALTRVGRIVDGTGARARTATGAAWTPPRAGYAHFAD